MSPAPQVSKEAQRRYDAITLYLAEKAAAEGEMAHEGIVPSTLEERPRTSPAREGGIQGTGRESSDGAVPPKRSYSGENDTGLNGCQIEEFLLH